MKEAVNKSQLDGKFYRRYEDMMENPAKYTYPTDIDVLLRDFSLLPDSLVAKQIKSNILVAVVEHEYKQYAIRKMFLVKAIEKAEKELGVASSQAITKRIGGDKKPIDVWNEIKEMNLELTQLTDVGDSLADRTIQHAKTSVGMRLRHQQQWTHFWTNTVREATDNIITAIEKQYNITVPANVRAILHQREQRILDAVSTGKVGLNHLGEFGEQEQDLIILLSETVSEQKKAQYANLSPKDRAQKQAKYDVAALRSNKAFLDTVKGGRRQATSDINGIKEGQDKDLTNEKQGGESICNKIHDARAPQTTKSSQNVNPKR